MSSNGVEFEDPPTLGRCHRIVEIDTVDDADELDTERNAARERTEDVAEVPNALRRVELGRADFFVRPRTRWLRGRPRADYAPIGPRPKGPRPNACLLPQ